MKKQQHFKFFNVLAAFLMFSGMLVVTDNAVAKPIMLSNSSSKNSSKTKNVQPKKASKENKKKDGAANSAKVGQTKKELSQINSKIQAEKDKQSQLERKVELTKKEILDVQRKMVAAASSIQEQEESLGRLEQKMHEFEMGLDQMKNRLSLRKRQRIYVLAALQNLAWKPTEALFIQPMPAEYTLRSALLLREVVPRLEYTTDELNEDIAKVSSLTGAIKAQYAQIKTYAKRLEEKRKNMDGLLLQKTKLQDMFAQESKQARLRAENLAKQASDLRDLVVKLEQESLKRKKEKKNVRSEETGAFMASKGKIPYPVKGTIVKKYGDATDTGPSKGIVIQTRGSAQVISPFDGTVLFAGPFRGYGQLMIIEHDGGHHTLLAGMGRLDAVVGSTLMAGEPVGLMSDEISPTLYVELRKDGQPINPSGYMKNK